MQIKYVKHPVTPAEKKKINDAGFKIIDERFKPKCDTEAEEKPPRRARVKV